MKEQALAGRKILVVDDEPDQLAFIATVLEDNGAAIIEAQDGEQALQKARSEKPNLITLDLGLPGKSGIDVFAQLRSDEALAAIPVCIITGRPELRKLIYEMSAVTRPEGYLDKPIDPEDLLQAIRRILELRERRSARQE